MFLLPFGFLFVCQWRWRGGEASPLPSPSSPFTIPDFCIFLPVFCICPLLVFVFAPLSCAKYFFFLDTAPALLERVEHFGLCPMPGQQPSKKPSSFIAPPRKRGQNTGWGEASIQESIFSFKTYFLILNSYEHLLATSELKSGNKFVFTPTKIVFLSSSTYRAWREII